MEVIFTSSSPEETRLFGKRLGLLLRGGDVICLIGGLGAGKTAFAQGIGEGLGVKTVMTSPTFTLMQEYSALAQGEAVRLVHMDLYRLRHPEEAEVIGVEDQFQTDVISLIEWPEIAREFLPADRLEVVIEGSGDTPRRITFRTESGTWNRLWIQKGNTNKE